MWFLDDFFEKEDFNFREKFNIRAASIFGFLTPILATRCLIYSIRQPQGWKEDLASWIASAALTAYPICYRTSMMLCHYSHEDAIEMCIERREEEKLLLNNPKEEKF